MMEPDEKRDKFFHQAVDYLRKKENYSEQKLLALLMKYSGNGWDLSEEDTKKLIIQQRPKPIQEKNERTQVGISKATRQKLREAAHKGQTYEDVIEMLVQFRQSHKDKSNDSDDVAVFFRPNAKETHQKYTKSGFAMQDFEEFVRAAYYDKLNEVIKNKSEV